MATASSSELDLMPVTARQPDAVRAGLIAAMTGPVAMTRSTSTGSSFIIARTVWIVRRPFGDRDELDGPAGARRLANE